MAASRGVQVAPTCRDAATQTDPDNPYQWKWMVDKQTDFLFSFDSVDNSEASDETNYHGSVGDDKDGSDWMFDSDEVCTLLLL